MRPPLKGGLSKMASPCKMLQVTLGEDHHQWKRDMHPNGEIIKRGYDAFGRGDMPTVFGILDGDPMACPRSKPPLRRLSRP
jgi:hypothetical protein